MATVGNYLIILGQITGMIAAVPNVENVHARQRHVADWKALLALFKVGAGTTSTFQGWMVSRSAVSEEWLTNLEVLRLHTFKIRGVLGVNDAADSEGAFNALIEGVADALRTDYDLAGNAELHQPIQWQVIDYRIFAGVLCHYTEGSLVVQERLLGGD